MDDNLTDTFSKKNKSPPLDRAVLTLWEMRDLAAKLPQYHKYEKPLLDAIVALCNYR